MPFTEIEKFSHGEYPTATKLNKLIDNQEFLDPSIDDKVYGIKDGSRLVFIHKLPYLWYKGSGTITDFADPTNTLSLSDGSPSRYDLSSISWLLPGKLYITLNFDYCFEFSS